MKDTISTSSVVVVAKDQVSCDLKGEAAILNLKNGVYYGLDSVGSRIWDLLQQPRTVQEILNVLIKEYDVEPGRCESDLLALLEEMQAESLIIVRDEKFD